MIGVMRDPLQGFDIRVSVNNITNDGSSGSQRLAGAFNSFMWRVISQTEAYLMLGSRIPRMLDGELITVWSLDQGLINMDVVGNSFGPQFATQFATKSRGAVIPRQTRMHITAHAGADTISEFTQFGPNDAGFNTDGGGAPSMNVTLKYARVDTLTFGVAPGKSVAANSWQGTAEGCDDGSTSTAAATTTP